MGRPVVDILRRRFGSDWDGVYSPGTFEGFWLIGSVPSFETLSRDAVIHRSGKREIFDLHLFRLNSTPKTCCEIRTL